MVVCYNLIPEFTPVFMNAIVLQSKRTLVVYSHFTDEEVLP